MCLGRTGQVLKATRDLALGGATRPPPGITSPPPRGCLRARRCAPSVPGHLLTQNLEPSSPEPHRASMGPELGCEDGEHGLYQPGTDLAPAQSRLQPRAPPPPAPPSPSPRPFGSN